LGGGLRLYMKHPFIISSAFLITFLIAVFGIAWRINTNYPRLIFAGESSVATWVSGMLLVMCGTFSLVLANRSKSLTWLSAATFFFVLAVDERFMMHEYIKQRLIFGYPSSSNLVHELPVIGGALVGSGMSFLLWRDLSRGARLLLLGGVILGSVSVVIDIMDAGVITEEIAKILAEVMITIALLSKISIQDVFKPLG
jgi:hypothetical protein